VRDSLGYRNILADSLSKKDLIINTEWSVHPRSYRTYGRVVDLRVLHKS
jgi:hypothetical protein